MHAHASVSVRAMPKRVAPPVVDDIKVEQAHCVMMGNRSQPLRGVRCANQFLLRRVVGDRTRGDATMVVKKFVDEAIQAMQQQAASEAEERSLVVADKAPVEVPKGRVAMGLDTDSDEGVLAEMPMAVARPP